MAAIIKQLKDCCSAQAWKDCPYTKCVIELEGTFFLMAIAATQNGDALAFGLIYALLYANLRKNDPNTILFKIYRFSPTFSIRCTVKTVEMDISTQLSQLLKSCPAERQLGLESST